MDTDTKNAIGLCLAGAGAGVAVTWETGPGVIAGAIGGCLVGMTAGCDSGPSPVKKEDPGPLPDAGPDENTPPDTPENRVRKCIGADSYALQFEGAGGCSSFYSGQKVGIKIDANYKVTFPFLLSQTPDRIDTLRVTGRLEDGCGVLSPLLEQWKEDLVSGGPPERAPEISVTIYARQSDGGVCMPDDPSPPDGSTSSKTVSFPNPLCADRIMLNQSVATFSGPGCTGPGVKKPAGLNVKLVARPRP